MVTLNKQDGGAPQTPLGGRLVERALKGDHLEAALERAQGLPRIMIDREAECAGKRGENPGGHHFEGDLGLTVNHDAGESLGALKRRLEMISLQRPLDQTSAKR